MFEQIEGGVDPSMEQYSGGYDGCEVEEGPVAVEEQKEKQHVRSTDDVHEQLGEDVDLSGIPSAKRAEIFAAYESGERSLGDTVAWLTLHASIWRRTPTGDQVPGWPRYGQKEPTIRGI